jgi:hypothetical protein
MEGQVIQFTKKLYEVEDYMTIPFDIDMKAKIIKEEPHPKMPGVLCITLDMEDFLEENIPNMRNNWQSDRGQVILNWSQTKYWPADNKVKIVVYKDKKPYKIVK